ncbi:MAG: hypothetical protein R3B13_36220 [Polyangiaceae bacterium]
MAGERSRTCFWLRVSVLVSVLCVVLLWAWNDRRRRAERTRWHRNLHVALILTTQGDVSPDAVSALSARVADLETHLGAEMRRHRPGSELRPVVFQVFGPLQVADPAPRIAGDDLSAAASHAYASWRYFRSVDQSLDVPWRAFDARLYLGLVPPKDKQTHVEGQSEQGGWVGTVQVELDASMVDFALFVATHELFHVLGASDKYDATGRAIVPDGLADPHRLPLYPQSRAEVMARNVALGRGLERPPTHLTELCVGERTAREIGWR